MANTAWGMPYPVPTDPVAQGADAIKALAEAVDKLRHQSVVSRVMTATWTMANPTAWTDFPAGADATALQSTFVKGAAATTLVLRMYGSIYLNSGVSQNVFFGLNIGGVDVQVAQCHPKNGPDRVGIFGAARVTGHPAGNLAVKVRVRTQTASELQFFASDEFITYEIEETVA